MPADCSHSSHTLVKSSPERMGDGAERGYAVWGKGEMGAPHRTEQSRKKQSSDRSQQLLTQLGGLQVLHGGKVGRPCRGEQRCEDEPLDRNHPPPINGPTSTWPPLFTPSCMSSVSRQGPDSGVASAAFRRSVLAEACRAERLVAGFPIAAAASAGASSSFSDLPLCA